MDGEDMGIDSLTTIHSCVRHRVPFTHIHFKFKVVRHLFFDMKAQNWENFYKCCLDYKLGMVGFCQWSINFPNVLRKPHLKPKKQSFYEIKFRSSLTSVVLLCSLCIIKQKEDFTESSTLNTHCILHCNMHITAIDCG